MIRFAVICIKENDCCAVVAEGEYHDLLDVTDSLKEQYNEESIRVIEVDESDYNEIKSDAIKLNNKFITYFNDLNQSNYSTVDDY